MHPDALRERLDRLTSDREAPLAVVDLDAFDRNADDLVRRAGGKPIRVASKSVRCTALLRRVLDRSGFAGVMAFTLPEALWLDEQGFEDVMVAYPTADRAALARLAGRPGAATVCVDAVEQLELLAPGVRVCLDLDASWRPLGGRVRIGARRSPVFAPEQAAALAREAVARGLVVEGVLAYEAQVAGVGDRPLPIALMQRLSLRELAPRRAACVAAVQDAIGGPVRFVNGGGTGSLERTAREPAVTELAAGSGLYGPGLFDGYRAFRPQPAALFALPVVRRPGPGVATLLGGGYLASGSGDRSRLPKVHAPAGLRLDGREGAGEVQTPVLGAAADGLRVGDRVWLRHAKAGELCERFDRLVLVAGDAVVDEVPTYRGEGQTFL